MKNHAIPGFRPVPKTGVIYVMEKAKEVGYSSDDAEWANLGQGAPETSAFPDAPEREGYVKTDSGNQEYSPVPGLRALRQKVADFYNHFYRRGKSSKYTYQNVSISGGGRAALTRLAASLGNINMGHFIPDYTAYEELLSIFKAFTPLPILLSPESTYRISDESLTEEITGRGLSAILISNPCNPTGQLIEGDDLWEWVRLARDYRCTFIMDEFYSHYVYTHAVQDGMKIVSAAEYVEDVNTDPVIIVDGLTKNWRFPGWRISWTVAPEEVIERVASAGSFLDGGANNPFQEEAVRLLEPDYTERETKALQRVFLEKRDYLLSRLSKLDIDVEMEPAGAFYVWANLSKLPPPLDDGMNFFKEGLKEKVITVPGIFFDVNPGKRRSYARYQAYTRISFGPEMEELATGLDSVERMIDEYT